VADEVGPVLSGRRLIAGTSRAAQGLIIAGVAIVLLSATLIVRGV
jgi:hypothetical protein